MSTSKDVKLVSAILCRLNCRFDLNAHKAVGQCGNEVEPLGWGEYALPALRLNSSSSKIFTYAACRRKMASYKSPIGLAIQDLTKFSKLSV